MKTPRFIPAWLRVDRLLGEHGIQADTAAGRQEFERRLEQRRLEAADEAGMEVFRRAWCLGGKPFQQQMLQRMEGELGANHSGELRRQSAEAKADRIVAEELSRLGWNGEDLAARRKNDPSKLAIAARLRKETTLTIKSIAARVHLGTSKSANARLHGWMAGAGRPLQLPPVINLTPNETI